MTFTRMILRSILSASFALASLSAFCMAPGFFAPSSRLSSGKWVKIGVEKSGIYEISYTALREMGFSDPSKVGVLGRGGRQMELDFVDEEGNRLNPDDLSPISVYHHDDYLYFFGQGVESFSFTKSKGMETGGYYQRVSKNLYSELGYYFLSDRDGSLLLMEEDEEPEMPTRLESGVSFVSHEKDMMQNTTHTGQLFWGERFNNGEPSRREWKYFLPDVLSDVKAVMECYFYSERTSTGQLSWGVKDSQDIRSGATRNYNSLKFRPQEPTIHTTTIPNQDFSVFIDYSSEDNPDGIANLDYWTLTYGCRIPTLKGLAGTSVPHAYIGFPELEGGGVISLEDMPYATVFNVSDPLHPRFVLPKKRGQETVAVFSAGKSITDIYVADLSRPQLHIKGYSSSDSSVANQDLHAIGRNGASLLIIAVPQLMEQAERLAQIHRDHDGIGVIVASSEQIYNEFSAGVPDPMAYRTFAKLIYESGGEQLRNVLLLGQLQSDFRGVDVKRNPYSSLIAFQSSEGEPEKGAPNANDIIGMMSDRMPDSRLERCPVHVGVGILPCVSPQEADAYIDKVERYLTDDSFAYRLNKTMTIGGLGDRHTHDEQAIALGKYLNTNNSGHFVVDNLIIDAYGSEEARKRFIGGVEAGQNIVTYFGHGGPTMLGKNMNFFNTADVTRFNNEYLPFMIFAGCLLSNSDRGIRGLAEKAVLGSDAGFIGAMLATRDTWSGENMDLVKIVMNRMYKDGNSVTSPRLPEPLTIGEVYARAKDQSEYSNELSYQLLCDPAIRIPVATGDVKTDDSSKSIIPGKEFKLSGFVSDSEGREDKSFNGELVVRVMYPEISFESPDLESASREDGDVLTVPVTDQQATAGATTVRDGRFSISLPIPLSLESASGKETKIYLCAYDKERKRGAASSLTTVVNQPTAGDIVRPDRTAPVIGELSYDSDARCLNISVTDNSALDLSSTSHHSSFTLSIDGKALRSGVETIMRFIPDAVGYTKSIPVGYLPEGSHSARLEVADAEGNAAVKEIVFRVGSESDFAIRLLSEVAREKALFEVTGYPENAVIEIVNDKGDVVRTLSVAGSVVEWDLTSSNGGQMGNGLYRATMREGKGSAGERSSSVIDVPVIASSRQ